MQTQLWGVVRGVAGREEKVGSESVILHKELLYIHLNKHIFIVYTPNMIEMTFSSKQATWRHFSDQIHTTAKLSNQNGSDVKAHHPSMQSVTAQGRFYTAAVFQ